MTDLHKRECTAFRFIRWKDLIIELEGAGWPSSAIADALCIPKTTLAGWKNEGFEPRYSYGAALLLLHSKVFGSKYTEFRTNQHRESAIKATASAG